MKLRNEIWKDIPEYSNYQISSLGNVRSNKYGDWRLLKPALDGAGYLIGGKAGGLRWAYDFGGEE